jgi:hypothetical protein
MELVHGTSLSAWLAEHGRMPLDQFVALAGDTPTQVREYIYNTGRMLTDQGYFSSASDDLKTYANLLDEVTARFVKFLTTGLAAGDAPWP